ncbi:MAG: LysR family transcriptional regulator [Gammaproteobacteria bacterium]|nr:LysR family transcriptional regulator [Gammaproteobacteria bacterium]
MNIAGLNLRDLTYVVAVAQHGHFGKAAKACYVSQPALSSQIKKIEELLGVTIFERSNRSVAVSDVGHAIVQQARIVLEEAEKIFSLAKTTTEPLAGPLRLGAIATLGPYLMPYLLSPLRQAFPQLELILKEGLTDGLLAQLRAGNLDAMLAARTFDEDGLTVIPLFKEPFLLTAPKNHPLAGKNPLTVHDLRAADMVLLEDGHCLRDETLAFCPANSRGHIKEFHATSLETLRHLVASGAGYTLMPMLAVNQDERLKGLVRYRRLGGKEAGRTIVLVCRERFSRKRDVLALADFIRRHLPKTSIEKLTVTAAS